MKYFEPIFFLVVIICLSALIWFEHVNYSRYNQFMNICEAEGGNDISLMPNGKFYSCDKVTREQVMVIVP